MRRENKRIAAIITLIFCILFITACTRLGKAKNISENEIYPKGTLSRARVFDADNNEKIVSLSNEDTKFILDTLKNSKKELSKDGYENDLVELNIVFTDATIQLVRRDNKTIYYVFHNNKIDGICYKIKSKDLSQFISKVSS